MLLTVHNLSPVFSETLVGWMHIPGAPEGADQQAQNFAAIVPHLTSLAINATMYPTQPDIHGLSYKKDRSTLAVPGWSSIHHPTGPLLKFRTALLYAQDELSRVLDSMCDVLGPPPPTEGDYAAKIYPATNPKRELWLPPELTRDLSILGQNPIVLAEPKTLRDR